MHTPPPAVSSIPCVCTAPLLSAAALSYERALAHVAACMPAGAGDSLVQKRKRSMQDSVQHLRRLASEKSATLSNLKLSPRDPLGGPQIPASRLRCGPAPRVLPYPTLPCPAPPFEEKCQPFRHVSRIQPYQRKCIWTYTAPSWWRCSFCVGILTCSLCTQAYAHCTASCLLQAAALSDKAACCSGPRSDITHHQ